MSQHQVKLWQLSDAENLDNFKQKQLYIVKLVQKRLVVEQLWCSSKGPLSPHKQWLGDSSSLPKYVSD